MSPFGKILLAIGATVGCLSLLVTLREAAPLSPEQQALQARATVQLNLLLQTLDPGRSLFIGAEPTATGEFTILCADGWIDADPSLRRAAAEQVRRSWQRAWMNRTPPVLFFSDRAGIAME